MVLGPATAINLFYCYAQEDEIFRYELEKHLSIMRHQNLITEWHRRKIMPGSEWIEATQKHLNEAQIILLLISSDFLASKEQYGVEMQRAVQRHQIGEACVIPIILRPVDWKHDPFLKRLKVLPTNEQPVTSWPSAPSYDEAFAEIAKGIRLVIEGIPKHPAVCPPMTSPVWNVPFRRNPFFTGREVLLKQICRI